jgi:glutathione S-transferase
MGSDPPLIGSVPARPGQIGSKPVPIETVHVNADFHQYRFSFDQRGLGQAKPTQAGLGWAGLGWAGLGQMVKGYSFPSSSLPGHMSATDLPILYSFRRCPYAMRARLALAASGRHCELREVALRAKPAELLQASPKGTVPVLVLPDGTVIDQSLDIMRWALAQHDPEQWLTPEHGTAAAMEALIAQCDGAFKADLDRYKYPNRYPDTDALAHRAAGAAYLTTLDTRLQASPYLFGARACLADMAIAPFVRQFASTDAAWFAAQPWPALAGWLNAFVASARFELVMEKAVPWVSGTPGVRFPPVD